MSVTFGPFYQNIPNTNQSFPGTVVHAYNRLSFDNFENGIPGHDLGKKVRNALSSLQTAENDCHRILVGEFPELETARLRVIAAVRVLMRHVNMLALSLVVDSSTHDNDDSVDYEVVRNQKIVAEGAGMCLELSPVNQRDLAILTDVLDPNVLPGRSDVHPAPAFRKLKLSAYGMTSEMLPTAELEHLISSVRCSELEVNYRHTHTFLAWLERNPNIKSLVVVHVNGPENGDFDFIHLITSTHLKFLKFMVFDDEVDTAWLGLPPPNIATLTHLEVPNMPVSWLLAAKSLQTIVPSSPRHLNQLSKSIPSGVTIALKTKNNTEMFGIFNTISAKSVQSQFPHNKVVTDPLFEKEPWGYKTVHSSATRCEVRGEQIDVFNLQSFPILYAQTEFEREQDGVLRLSVPATHNRSGVHAWKLQTLSALPTFEGSARMGRLLALAMPKNDLLEMLDVSEALQCDVSIDVLLRALRIKDDFRA